MTALASIFSFNRAAWRANMGRNGWVLLSFLLILLILLPVSSVFLALFKPASPNWQHIVNNLLGSYIYHSIFIVVCVSALTILWGVPTAWLVTQYDFPGRRILELGLILPLAIPTYIIAYTYAGIFSMKGPVMQVSGLHLDIMNIYGLVFILSFVLYPYVYLISRSSFAIQSRQHLEAAKMLGSGKLQTFFKVALPLSRTAIFGGMGLVVMELLNDYGAMKYFGIPTFTTGIFRAWFSMGDLNAAIRLAVCLVVFIILLFLLEKLQRGKARFADRSRGTRKSSRIKLKGSKAALVAAVCAFPVLMGFILPIMQLLTWTMKTFGEVQYPDFFQLIFNSFFLAFLAAAICTIVALFIIFSRNWSRSVLLQGLSRLSTIGYAIPGAVIAIGVMIPVLLLEGPMNEYLGLNYGLLVNSTVIVLVFAYLVRFLAVSYNSVESTYKRLPGSLTEAARIMGSGAGKTWYNIHLPLVKGGLVTAFLLVFVDVLKELSLTLILRPFNFDTLATKAFELAADERIAEAANPALIIIITGFIPILLLNRMLSKNEA